jgi:hypothetical protein
MSNIGFGASNYPIIPRDILDAAPNHFGVLFCENVTGTS